MARGPHVSNLLDTSRKSIATQDTWAPSILPGIPPDSLLSRPPTTLDFQMDAMEEDPITASSTFPDGVLDVQGTPNYVPPPSCKPSSQTLCMCMPLIHCFYLPIVSSHPPHVVSSCTHTDKLPRVSRRSSQSAYKKTRKRLLGIPWTCARLAGDRRAVITCRYEQISIFPCGGIVLIGHTSSDTFHVVW